MSVSELKPTSRMHAPVPILLIGAQKSGSSYLFRLIAQDPTIAQARLKEPKIFSKPMHDRDEFLSFFRIAPEHIFVLDGSVSYMHVAGTAEQVARRLGTIMPVLVVLRDPVERAVSGYLHEVKHGRELRLPAEVFDLPGDLDDAVAAEDEAIQAAWRRGVVQPHNPPKERYRDPFFQFRYVGNSCYARQLTPWFREFCNMRLVEFDDLRADPVGVAARVRAWIGLDNTAPVEIKQARNPTRLSVLQALRENRALLHDYQRPGLLQVWNRQQTLLRQLRAEKPTLPLALAEKLRRSYTTFRHQELPSWL